MSNTDALTGWVVTPEDDAFHSDFEGAGHLFVTLRSGTPTWPKVGAPMRRQQARANYPSCSIRSL